MKCKNYHDLTKWQYDQLLQHVRDNQYYLGQKLGHPVDWKDAENDFFSNYIKTVGKELRLNYCNNYCNIGDCELRELFNKKSIDN